MKRNAETSEKTAEREPDTEQKPEAGGHPDAKQKPEAGRHPDAERTSGTANVPATGREDGARKAGRAETIGSSLLLLLTALIWGAAFVAQRAGMDYVGPYTFNASRFFLGGTVLLPVIALRSRGAAPMGKREKRTLAAGGILCGLALCTASSFQQIGLLYTSVGKAGFLTTLYIVLVPLFGLALGRRIRPLVWAGAALACAGLYLLCMKESFSIQKGDALLLVCAAVFAVHILIIDHVSPKTDAVRLSCIQFYVSALVSLVLALLLETPSPEALARAAVPVLYAGVLSCGVAYTLQIVGQKRLDPTVASLILSLESVVSALAGWVLLGQRLSRRELLGCVIVFAAVILVQLPEKRERPEQPQAPEQPKAPE